MGEITSFFTYKLEKVQYRPCLALTGAIQGTSRRKRFDELGLHSLNKRLTSVSLEYAMEVHLADAYI